MQRGCECSRVPMLYTSSNAHATSIPSTPPQGLLPEAVAAARMFLPRGATVLTLCKPSHRVCTFRCRWYHRREISFRNRRLFILVDENSASAGKCAAILLMMRLAVMQGSRAILHDPAVLPIIASQLRSLLGHYKQVELRWSLERPPMAKAPRKPLPTCPTVLR